MTRYPKTRTFVRRGALSLVAALLLLCGAAGPSAEESPMEKANALFAAQKWDEAAAAYESIVEAAPGNADAWQRLGIARRQLGRFDEAIAALHKAEEAGMDNANVHTSLALSYASLGRKDEAFEELRKAVDRHLPPGYLASADDLASLRDDPRFAPILQAAKKKAHPCENDPKYGAFDFWVGDWDVYVGDRKVGTNRIEKLLGGCLLLENWTDAHGTQGKSFNYFDPSAGKWRQNWVSEVGGVVRYEGEVKDGAMHYEGENVRADGTTRMARVLLQPTPDGNVHHVIEESSDHGATWHTSFDALYVPKGSRD
jgi:tetratricopeptide (TPR) repeat protein